MRSLANRRHQQGLGLIGLLLVGAMIVILGTVGLKVFPTALEYFAVKRAVSRAAASSGSAAEAQQAFDRTAAVDDITSITSKDLIITKQASGGLIVAFKYEKRIPLIGPASLVLDYEGSSQR